MGAKQLKDKLQNGGGLPPQAWQKTNAHVQIPLFHRQNSPIGWHPETTGTALRQQGASD
jgi:hypothetical protein